MQALSISKHLAYLSHEDHASPKGLDVRSRIFVTLLCSVTTIVISSLEGQLVLFSSSFLYALSIRRFRALLIAHAFLAGMLCVAMRFTLGINAVMPAMPFSFKGIAVPFMRGAVMLNVVLPLALTSRIQALLTVLKSLHLPFCIYIPGAVMIRFIPTFMNDIKQVAETLKIRGYNVGFKEMCLSPRMMLRLLFTPLLFRSLRTSEDLGIAAELKGLEDGGRFVPSHSGSWTMRDTALVFLALGFAALAFYCHALCGGTALAMH